jgi:hypothetical protein
MQIGMRRGTVYRLIQDVVVLQERSLDAETRDSVPKASVGSLVQVIIQVRVAIQRLIIRIIALSLEDGALQSSI